MGCPKLSVIIPTRDRARRIADLLGSMGRMVEVDFEWEALIIVNSTDEKDACAIASVVSEVSTRARVVREPRLGLHHARHRGLRDTDAEFVAFLDDDMLLDPAWIQGLEPLLLGQADAVVGRIRPKWEGSPAPWLLKLIGREMFPALGILNLGDEAKEVDALDVWGGNCFHHRGTLLELGGFNPDITARTREERKFIGDGETGLMMKYKERGCRALYDPRATAYHIIDGERVTVEYLCDRFFRQGVCDSYTALRGKHGLVPRSAVHDGMKSSWEALRSASPRRAAALLKKRARRYLLKWTDPEQAAIDARLRHAYRDGWEYHQREVLECSELLDYVLQETYLEVDGGVGVLPA